MAEAVIVATARTPIGRANKGSLVDVRPDDMSAFIISSLLDKVPELDRNLVEDVLWGCTTCRACEEQCPVNITYVDKIVQMRRNLVAPAFTPSVLSQRLPAA